MYLLIHVSFALDYHWVTIKFKEHIIETTVTISVHISMTQMYVYMYNPHNKYMYALVKV